MIYFNLFKELGWIVNKTQLNDRLVSYPTPQPDPAAIANKSVNCFHEYQLIEKPCLKKLLITNWALLDGMEAFDDLYHLWELLLHHDQVELYVYNSRKYQFIRVTSMARLSLELLEIKPIARQEALKIAAKQGMAADEVVLIDYQYYLNFSHRLQKIQLPVKYHFKPYHFSNTFNLDDLEYVDPQKFTNIIQSLDCSAINAIYLSTSYKASGHYFKLLLQHCPNIIHIQFPLDGSLIPTLLEGSDFFDKIKKIAISSAVELSTLSLEQKSAYFSKLNLPLLDELILNGELPFDFNNPNVTNESFLKNADLSPIKHLAKQITFWDKGKSKKDPGYSEIEYAAFEVPEYGSPKGMDYNNARKVVLHGNPEEVEELIKLTRPNIKCLKLPYNAYNLEVLTSLVHAIPNLHFLSLVEKPSDLDGANNVSLLNGLKKLGELFSFNNLTSLRFGDFDAFGDTEPVPVEFIKQYVAMSPNLESLTINSIYEQIEQLPSIELPSSLFRLELSFMRILVDNQRCGQKLIGKYVTDFFKSIAPTLRILEITYTEEGDREEENEYIEANRLDFSNLGDNAFQQLTQLIIHGGSYANIIPLIKASKNTLEFITIDGEDVPLPVLNNHLDQCPKLKGKKLFYCSKEHSDNGSENTLDENTLTNADTSMTAIQLFLTKDPVFDSPALYVKNTFDQLSIDASENLRLFTTVGSSVPYECPLKIDTKLIDYYELQPEPLLALGKITLGGDNGPYWLPGLSLADELLAIEANEPLRVSRHQNGAYSVRRLSLGEPLDIQFLVRTGRTHYTPSALARKVPSMCLSPDAFFSNIQFTRLPQGFTLTCRNPALQSSFFLTIQYYQNNQWHGIDEVIKFCRAFTNQSLPPAPQPRTGVEILNAILEHKTGACRHVVYVFMALAPFLFPNVPVRAIRNDVHAFVILNNSMTVDLGGHAVQLNLIPFNQQDAGLDGVDFDRMDELPIRVNELALKTRVEPDGVVKTILEKSEQLPAQHRQILVICQNKEHIRDLAVLIGSSIDLKQTQLHYIDDLDTVRATQYTIEPDGHHKAIESPECLFLKQAQPHDIIFINYAAAKPEHVGYNSVVDEHRLLLNQAIPPGVLVVMAITQEQVSSLREDFYSRFDRKKAMVSLTECILPHQWREPTSCESKNPHSIESVNLYEANDWQQILVNSIEFNQKGLVWKPGRLLTLSEPLKQHPQQRVTLSLVNPPWHNEQFLSFWAQINATKSLIANGRYYALPANLTIICAAQPYLVPHDTYSILEAHPDKPWSYSLNSATYDTLFYRYRVNPLGYLETLPGLLAEHQNKPLTLMVSETMGKAHWAKLLAKAQSESCCLQLILAPGVLLPAEMNSSASTSTAMSAMGLPQSAATPHQLIISNDPEYTLERFKSVDQVLTITQDVGRELCEHWSIQQQDNAPMTYVVEHGLLLQYLLQGQTVVLKGELSSALARQLETVFSCTPSIPFQNTQLPINGRLIIITPQKHYFSFVQPEYEEVQESNYWNYLFSKLEPQQYQLLKQLCSRFALTLSSFAQVKHLYSLVTHLPHRCPIEPWILLQQNAKEILARIAKEYPQNVLPSSASSMQRLHDIDMHLKHFPTLFLVGPSGTGKSTMVLKRLPEYYKSKEITTRIFVGLDKINRWINNTPAANTLNILFIDEANLAHEGAYDFLTSLTQASPQFIYQGKRYVVPESCKIIFAGNYFNYQARQTQHIFQQLGNAMHVPPSSLHEIQDQHLNPLLELLFPTQPDMKRYLSELLVQTLLFIQNQCPQVTITSRNLHAMALLSAVYQNQPQNPFPQDVLARWAVYQTIKACLSPHELQQLIAKVFDHQDYQIQFQDGFSSPVAHFEQFVMTNTHRPTLMALNEELAIRKLRQQRLDLEEYGTRGLLIQGPSGIGKSSIVIAALKAKGFIDATHCTTPLSDTPHYYYLSRSLGLEAIKKLATQAFHTGGVVIIDEANSLPLENFFNDLLTGVDADGNKATRPGFLLIATQNPPDFNGRVVQSAAFLNRLRLIELTDYPAAELKIILQSRLSLPSKLAERLIAHHLHEKQTSMIPPTLRDLIREAQQAINEQLDDLSLIEQPEEKSRLLQQFTSLDIAYQNKVSKLCSILKQTRIEEKTDYFFLLEVLDAFAAAVLKTMNNKHAFFSPNANHPLVDVDCLCQEAWKKLAPYLKKIKSGNERQECIDEAKRNKLFRPEMGQFSSTVMQKLDKIASQGLVERKRIPEKNSNVRESDKKQKLGVSLGNALAWG